MRGRYPTVLVFLGVCFLMISWVHGQEGTQKIEGGMVSTQRIEALKGIQASHEDRVMAIPGVVGIGIGLTEDGKDLAFIVYVEKLTPSVKVQMPARIEGVPVRLIESGIFKAY